MKVVLFIGQHKVGSTALQKFLAQNSDLLLKSGILYPNVDFEGMSVLLAKMLGKKIKGNLPINFRESHNALAFRMISTAKGTQVPTFHKKLPAEQQMLHAIAQQVEYTQPHTVLLVAEVFSNFAVSAPKAIGKIRKLFEGADFRLVATLRRVDEYLVSWHGQRMKFGKKLKPLRKEATPKYFKSIHFDYQLMLEKWLEVFPDADLVLRNYADVLTTGGANEDFVKHSGVVFPKGMKSGDRSNPSLHRALMEVARLGNYALSPQDARKLRRYMINIAPRLELPNGSQIEMFGENNRSLMVEHFQPVQDYLNRISRSKAFFPDIDKLGQVLPVDELVAANEALVQLHKKRQTDLPEQAKTFLADVQLGE